MTLSTIKRLAGWPHLVEGYNVLSHGIMTLQKQKKFLGQDERTQFKNKITFSLREREIFVM
jgi:hypothetical protein